MKHRHESEMLKIKKLERVAFAEEIQRLQNLPKGSKLFKLDPFIDENGVLQVGGRLKLSSMPFEVKHPAILSKFPGMLQHASRLDSASLRTFFYEAMAIVNSRPLTTI